MAYLLCRHFSSCKVSSINGIKFLSGIPPSNSDAPQSVELLWTSDQPDNTQQSQEINIHVPGGIRTRNLSRQAAAEPCLRSRSHLDRQLHFYCKVYILLCHRMTTICIITVKTTKFWCLLQQNVSDHVGHLDDQ